MTKNVLLIITGSIAAYKSLDLIRLLTKANYNITPVMTRGAEEFITPLLVSAISQNRVLDRLFSADDESKIGHISLSRQNDAIVIAPATADFIAKIAGGLADDLASSIVLASNKPVFIAPAMNEKMWFNKQTQKNLQILRENGIRVLEPKADVLACGEYGVGKMVDSFNIFSNLQNFFNNGKILSGRKVVITVGATYEPIDPVRFIGNRSSGKQGIAIAEEFYNLGADVVLVAGNVREHINLPKENIIPVQTGLEMMRAVEDVIKKTDIFIATAAVADFCPKKVSKEKIKKSYKKPFKILDLVENVDILKTIGNYTKRPRIVIGFAAESSDLIKNAMFKLQAKNCDLILANDIRDGEVFGSDYNQITMIDKKGRVDKWDRMTKQEVAIKLAEKIGQLTIR